MGAGAVAVALAAATGCGSTPSQDAQLAVVTGFYPLQFVAERVGGDRVAVTNLAQPGTEPHDMELAPRQVASIHDAGLVLFVPGFQPAVDEAVAQAGAASLDVTTVVDMLTVDETGGMDDHGDEEEHADEVLDPHVWLDPTRLSTIASAVADRFSELDPAGAAAYQDRAEELATQLAELDGEFADGLRQCERREIVVSHAAFGYLADRYDLRQVAITGLSPETEPTPGELAQAAERAREVGATTVFFETLVSPAVAQAVADAIGAETAVLDPIEGLAVGAGGDYSSVMRENLATLRTALGCS